jgi:hypothetical protein
MGVAVKAVLEKRENDAKKTTPESELNNKPTPYYNIALL